MSTKQDIEDSVENLSPSPYKDDDSRASKNDLFYRSHVSGFGGIKQKYQVREGLNMRKREE